MATSPVKITVCPPHAASGYAPPEPVFGARARRPVSVEYLAHGEAKSTGLSFDEYSRAHVYVRKLNFGRHKDAPSWAFSKTEFRSLLARYCELRAGIRFPLAGTSAERVAYATHALRLTIPKKSETLAKMCAEYVALKNSGDNPARLYKLGQLIEGLDTTILLARRGPGFIAACAYEYYALGHDSVSIAAAFDMKPPTVRQLLYRLDLVWKKMQDGTDTPKTGRRKANPERGPGHKTKPILAVASVESEPGETPEEHERRFKKLYMRLTTERRSRLGFVSSAVHR